MTIPNLKQQKKVINLGKRREEKLREGKKREEKGRFYTRCFAVS